MRGRLLALLVALLLAQPDPGWLAPGSGVAWADDDGSGGDDDDPSASSGSDSPVAPPPRRRGAAPAAPAPQPLAPPLAAAGEVVATGLGAPALAALVAGGATVIESRQLASGNLAVRLRPSAGDSLDDLRAALAALDPGAAADLNHYYRPNAGHCEGPQCDALEQIGWPLPALAACDPGGVIGMIDTGINAGHETFAGGRVEVIRLAPESEAASGIEHGTAVASILVGAAGSRSPGLLPAARVLAVDAFHRAGSDERADAFALISGLDLLARRGVAVINLSLAGPGNAALGHEIGELVAGGTVLIASAGNGGPRSAPAFPAAFAGVIAVTAVDGRGEVYRRAAQGDHLDIAAPGVEVWAAASIRGARPKTGTSFATPYVTAAAYLLAANGVPPAEIAGALTAAARDIGAPGFDPVFGHGLLDTAKVCADWSE